MKTTKIYSDEKEVYRGICYVNTVIFRGRIYGSFKEIGSNGIKFSLQLSNGKRRGAAANSRSKTRENQKFNDTRFYFDKENSNEWKKPTFADCSAFGEIVKEILKYYKPTDEIWLIAKYYSKQVEGKYYKGFVVREIITEKEIEKTAQTLIGNDDLPF